MDPPWNFGLPAIVYSWNRTLGQQWPFFEFTCQDMFVAGEHAATENNLEYKVYKVYIVVYIVARLAFFSLARLARVPLAWSQSWARWLRTMVPSCFCMFLSHLYLKLFSPWASRMQGQSTQTWSCLEISWQTNCDYVWLCDCFMMFYVFSFLAAGILSGFVDWLCLLCLLCLLCRPIRAPTRLRITALETEVS